LAVAGNAEGKRTIVVALCGVLVRAAIFILKSTPPARFGLHDVSSGAVETAALGLFGYWRGVAE
jgi:hypothetical protein